MARRTQERWLEAARYYAANGWYVLPLYSHNSWEQCECGDRSCTVRRGHPWTDDWRREASRDEQDLVTWSEMREGAHNLAVVLGAPSRLLALVVDPSAEKIDVADEVETEDAAGEAIEHLEEAYGPLPPTISYRDFEREVYLFRLPTRLASVAPSGTRPATTIAAGITAHTGIEWIPAPNHLEASTRHSRRFEWIEPVESSALAEAPSWFLWKAGLIGEREFTQRTQKQLDEPRATHDSASDEPTSDGVSSDGAVGADADALDLVVCPRDTPSFVLEPDEIDEASSVLGFATAHDLLALHREGPQHVAGAWALTHCLSVLVGTPKTSGVTTFLLELARAVLMGSSFLGAATRRGPVVLVSDQSARPLAHTLRAAGLGTPETSKHLHVLTRDRLRDYDLTFDHAVELAAERAHEVGAELLVVDAVGRLSGCDTADPKTNWRRVAGPLNDAAAHGLAVVSSVHVPTPLSDIRLVAPRLGALAGAADIFLTLSTAPSQHAGARVLSALSRFVETPPVTHLRYEDHAYRRLGPELYPLFSTAGVDVSETHPKPRRATNASFRINTLLQSTGVA